MPNPDCATPEQAPAVLAAPRTSTYAGGAKHPIRVLVIDEPGMARDGLCALLESAASAEVIAATGSSREALQAMEALDPQLVVLDLSAALKTGPETIALLKRRWPEVAVLVLTLRQEEPCIEAALRAGADAYVLKSDSRTELSTALQRISAGQGYMSPRTLEKVVRAYAKDTGAVDPATRVSGSGALTHREQEVITLVARGYRTREMAELLSLSHKTVEKHRANVMRKLGLRSAAAMAAYAITHGFL